MGWEAIVTVCHIIRWAYWRQGHRLPIITHISTARKNTITTTTTMFI
jgi:hypothetical protein